MDSYTSDWNKESVMANATRLLHITQELAVDAVPKYTKKHYAQLGFGATSIGNLTEEYELILVQEAYKIAWEYFNLALQYVPIATTSLKLHTHHGLLGNFIGTVLQDRYVLIGDSTGVYTCASSDQYQAGWSEPTNRSVQPQPLRSEASTGRVLAGTRTCTIRTFWLDSFTEMSDVERMSAEEPISIPMSIDYWWLTWYPKQQYMMIHRTGTISDYCEYPSEVKWSYRVAPSSYCHYAYHHKFSNDATGESDFTVDLLRNYPVDRHQSEYAYEVLNAHGKFDWVRVEGSVPVYRCPPMFVDYFNKSFKGVSFVGDSSLEENNLYSDVLDSIDDPKEVGGFLLLESAVTRVTMFYLQIELFAIPLRELYPIHQDILYSKGYRLRKPIEHASGRYLQSAANNANWVYAAQDHPDIIRSYNKPPNKIYVGDVEYKLWANTTPSRNPTGLVMYPVLPGFLLTGGVNGFDDTTGFYEYPAVMLGVKYDKGTGEAYAICCRESNCVRDWTHPYHDYSPEPSLAAEILHNTLTGVDATSLLHYIKYESVPSGEFIAPTLRAPQYKFQVQLAKRPPDHKWNSSDIDYFSADLLKSDEVVDEPALRSVVYGHESVQYQFMLGTPTEQFGFYKPVLPPLPSDTLKFSSTEKVFNGS